MSELKFTANTNAIAEAIFDAQADEEGNLLGWADQGEVGKDHYRRIAVRFEKALKADGWGLTPPAIRATNFRRLVRNLTRSQP